MEERDFVSFIEACYRVDQREIDWLRGLAEAAVPLMGFGLGIHAYTVDLAAPDDQILQHPILVDGRPEWVERWQDDWWHVLMVPMAAEHKRLLHSLGAVSFATEVWDAGVARSTTYAEYMARFAERGYSSSHARYLRGESRAWHAAAPASGGMYPDSFNVAGIDASGQGVTLLANMPEVAAGAVPPAEAGLWNRLAAHMAAGYRLVRRMRGHAADDLGEAIITPSGKVEDASRELRDTAALEALRERVVAVDRLRSHERGDGRVAAEVWTGLAEARWSLVDHFERDGRRYYLARPNEPVARDVPALSEREEQVARAAARGHSNKLIAYELGVSTSTVATHLKSAAAKLGVASRLDLIRAIRQRGL